MYLSASSATGTERLTEAIQTVKSEDLSTILHQLGDFVVREIPDIAEALLVLLVGVVLIRFLLFGLRQLTRRSNKLDPTAVSFFLSAMRVGLYILLAVTVIATVVPSAIGGMVAAMSVFGLAVSLAVQDSLSNLAGGVNLLFVKPFSVGDYVQVDSIEGTVQEVRLTHTVLKTADNKFIHVPNGDVSKCRIVNFNAQTQRRLDLEFSIGYHNDFRAAQSIIRDILASHPHAKTEPEPVVRLLRHGDSALVLCCRVWVDTQQYWGLYFDLQEQVKEAFDAAGISIPYPQLDVHLSNQ